MPTSNERKMLSSNEALKELKPPHGLILASMSPSCFYTIRYHVQCHPLIWRATSSYLPSTNGHINGVIERNKTYC